MSVTYVFICIHTYIYTDVYISLITIYFTYLGTELPLFLKIRLAASCKAHVDNLFVELYFFLSFFFYFFNVQLNLGKLDRSQCKPISLWLGLGLGTACFWNYKEYIAWRNGYYIHKIYIIIWIFNYSGYRSHFRIRLRNFLCHTKIFLFMTGF